MLYKVDEELDREKCDKGREVYENFSKEDREKLDVNLGIYIKQTLLYSGMNPLKMLSILEYVKDNIKEAIIESLKHN